MGYEICSIFLFFNICKSSFGIFSKYIHYVWENISLNDDFDIAKRNT